MTTFAVLRQDVFKDKPECVLKSIHENHIKATESMLKFMNDDIQEYDELTIISSDRVHVVDRQPGRIYGAYKDLRLVYSIQEFTGILPRNRPCAIPK